MSARRYLVNEIFFSLQGEGVRAGTPNLFLRFSKCNLECRLDTHGFDCDTEFESGRPMTGDEIVEEMKGLAPECRWVVLTGGEPALQVDEDLIGLLRGAGFKLAIETNGTVALPVGLDWITVSPKVGESAIRQTRADEVKYVRAYGQSIPRTIVEAEHYLISPAFRGDELPRENLEWCLGLVLKNPSWRLSVQQHKTWGLR